MESNLILDFLDVLMVKGNLIFNRGPFKPRVPELLALEGQHGEITLSCRHKDILRCSITKHFKSCFAPKRCYENIPKLYCYIPEICIIFKRDKSGDFLGRAFGLFNGGKLFVNPIYGNRLTYECIKLSLVNKIYCEKVDENFYPTGLFE